jgi:hypothetical protein
MMSSDSQVGHHHLHGKDPALPAHLGDELLGHMPPQYEGSWALIWVCWYGGRRPQSCLSSVPPSWCAGSQGHGLSRKLMRAASMVSRSLKLSYKHHVRPGGGHTSGRLEALGVRTHFSLIYKRLLVLVEELYRVFHCHYMFVPFTVYLVHHGGKRGRLPRCQVGPVTRMSPSAC